MHLIKKNRIPPIENIHTILPQMHGFFISTQAQKSHIIKPPSHAPPTVKTVKSDLPHGTRSCSCNSPSPHEANNLQGKKRNRLCYHASNLIAHALLAAQLACTSKKTNGKVQAPAHLQTRKQLKANTRQAPPIRKPTSE